LPEPPIEVVPVPLPAPRCVVPAPLPLDDEPLLGALGTGVVSVGAGVVYVVCAGALEAGVLTLEGAAWWEWWRGFGFLRVMCWTPGANSAATRGALARGETAVSSACPAPVGAGPTGAVSIPAATVERGEPDR
jgi:hypothetical protein